MSSEFRIVAGILLKILGPLQNTDLLNRAVLLGTLHSLSFRRSRFMHLNLSKFDLTNTAHSTMYKEGTDRILYFIKYGLQDSSDFKRNIDLMHRFCALKTRIISLQEQFPQNMIPYLSVEAT